jgi:antibiotic biosynthesis monooxygenase (ABM) superfamily enzyme
MLSRTAVRERQSSKGGIEMYGTVARMRIKPGMEQPLAEQLEEFDSLGVPGFVRSTIYKLDAGGDEYMVAIAFETKDAYVANAESPEQDARYQKMRELLDSDPDWNDGEIVHTTA